MMRLCQEIQKFAGERKKQMLYYENRVSDFHVTPVSNWGFFPHTHHNMEILVCTSGIFGVSCRGTNCNLNPGDMMIAFSHDVHSYRKTGEGDGILMIINPQVLPLFRTRFQERRYENFLMGGGRFYISVAEAICQEYLTDRKREILVGYLYVLLGSAFKTLSYTKAGPGVSEDLFSNVMEYLSEHYSEHISLKTVAKIFGVDPCHLSRTFTKHLSYGFLKYLHMLRVEYAKDLLKNSNMKMSEIMENSGFADQKTFNRVFRELVNMTPREYRRCEDDSERTNLKRDFSVHGYRN